MNEAIMILVGIILVAGAGLVVGGLYDYYRNLSKPTAIFYTALAFYLGLFVVTFLSIANATVEAAYSPIHTL